MSPIPTPLGEAFSDPKAVFAAYALTEALAASQETERLLTRTPPPSGVSTRSSQKWAHPAPNGPPLGAVATALQQPKVVTRSTSTLVAPPGPPSSPQQPPHPLPLHQHRTVLTAGTAAKMKSEDGADAKKRPEKEAWRAKKEAEPKEAAESAVKMKTEEETTAKTRPGVEHITAMSMTPQAPGVSTRSSLKRAYSAPNGPSLGDAVTALQQPKVAKRSMSSLVAPPVPSSSPLPPPHTLPLPQRGTVQTEGTAAKMKAEGEAAAKKKPREEALRFKKEAETKEVAVTAAKKKTEKEATATTRAEVEATRPKTEATAKASVEHTSDAYDAPPARIQNGPQASDDEIAIPPSKLFRSNTLTL